MLEESTPPLRQLPTGTSARSRSFTALSTCPVISRMAVASSGTFISRTAERKSYQHDRAMPSEVTLMEYPGGNCWIPSKNVSLP